MMNYSLQASIVIISEDYIKAYKSEEEDKNY